MRIGIYTRKKDSGLPSLSWLDESGFNGFEIYHDVIKFEHEDVTQREGLNTLLFDAEMGHLDALYVDNLKVISSFTIKILEVLLEFQKMNLPLYYDNGCIKPDNKMIKHFHEGTRVCMTTIIVKVANVQIDSKLKNLTIK